MEQPKYQSASESSFLQGHFKSVQRERENQIGGPQGSISSPTHTLYECTTCDLLNGNTDPLKLVHHLAQENRGRRFNDPNMHKKLVTYPKTINAQISDLFAKSLVCPHCQAALSVLKENDSGAPDFETTGWDVECPGCHATGVVHND